MPIELLPIAGALVGFIVGLTGVGGGALMAPILLFGFGYSLPVVIATDLLFAAITKLTVTRTHQKNAFIDWQVLRRLWAGSIPATLVVVGCVQLGWVFESTDWLVVMLGVLIFISGLSLLLGQRIQTLQVSRRIDAPERFKRFQSPLTTLSGGILGTLVTLTSVGAGALGAVFLRSLYPLRMTPQKLVATDTLHAIPVSLLGGLSYLALGLTDLTLLFLLLLGSIPAAILGSRLLAILSPTLVRTFVAIALIVASIKLLVG